MPPSPDRPSASATDRREEQDRLEAAHLVTETSEAPKGSRRLRFALVVGDRLRA
jgi:hypothetical protein